MAGIKQFDRSKVLDRAMALSWTRGEEATSIQDLVQATQRGSWVSISETAETAHDVV